MNIQSARSNSAPENVCFRTEGGINILVKGNHEKLTEERIDYFVKEALRCIEELAQKPSKKLGIFDKVMSVFSSDKPSLNGKFVIFNLKNESVGFDVEDEDEDDHHPGSVEIRPLNMKDRVEAKIAKKLAEREREANRPLLSRAVGHGRADDGGTLRSKTKW